jgi:microcystin-dependent protein
MDYFIGSIQLFPYTFIPYGWALCNGQMLQVAQYNALYAAIGCTYGGNNSTTFAVPNMQGLEPIPNMRYFIAIEGTFPSKN